MYGTQCIDIISNIVFIQMFFTLFSNRMISFFTLQCELFTSCNVSNNASLVSARTGGGGVVNQMWTGLDRGRGGLPQIPKFVRTSFMDDPYICYWNTFINTIYKLLFLQWNNLMHEWLQKTLVYSLSYYFFAYFPFVSSSFYFMKLSCSFIV